MRNPEDRTFVFFCDDATKGQSDSEPKPEIEQKTDTNKPTNKILILYVLYVL